MTPQTEIEVRHKAELTVGPRGIALTDFDGMWRFADAANKSGLAPKQLASQPAIFIALQLGAEIGLPPMASLQSIAVINGRPTIWGDAMMAVCRATGELEEFSEWYEEGGTKLPRNPVTFTDKTVAVCRVRRAGYEPQETGFSVADAKTAGLWGKDGPWKQYPARMLKYRARSFALRDQFGDALRGLHSAEEIQDDPFENAKPAQTAPSTPTPAPDFSNRARKPRPEPTAPPATPEPAKAAPPQPETPPATVTQMPEPAPSEVDPTFLDLIQAETMEWCQERNVSFSDFVKWLVRTGTSPNAGDAEGWHELSTADLEKITAEDLMKIQTLHGKRIGGAK